MVVELLSLCGLSARRQSEKANERRSRILIISSWIEPEFLSACEVFQYLLQTELSVECVVVDGINQMATCRPFAYYLVVLLFRGIFRDMDFTKLLMHAVYSAPMQRCLDMVPVIADSNFDFPSIDTLLKRHPISAPFPGGRAHAEQVFQNAAKYFFFVGRLERKKSKVLRERRALVLVYFQVKRTLLKGLPPTQNHWKCGGRC